MDTRFRTVLLLVVFFITAFTIRLATLQLGSSEWMNKAENLTSDRYTIPPSRGQIFDRNGTLMVGSEATHDLMVTPKSLPVNLNGNCKSRLMVWTFACHQSVRWQSVPARLTPFL